MNTYLLQYFVERGFWIFMTHGKFCSCSISQIILKKAGFFKRIYNFSQFSSYTTIIGLLVSSFHKRSKNGDFIADIFDDQVALNSNLAFENTYKSYNSVIGYDRMHICHVCAISVVDGVEQ